VFQSFDYWILQYRELLANSYVHRLLMAKTAALEEQVKCRKEQAEQLMQAVLREAFNG